MKLTAATRNAILSAMIATGKVFDPLKVFVGIAQSIANNGLGTVLADVVPATGAVGTLKPVTAWSTAYVMTDGRAVVDGPSCLFQPAPGDAGQQVASWYLADALTAGNLIAFGDLPALVLLPDDKSAVSVVPRVTVDPDARWSAEVVYNG